MDNEINLLTIAADIAGKVDIDKVDKNQLKSSEYYMQSDLEELRRITKADSEGFNPIKIKLLQNIAKEAIRSIYILGY